MVKKYVRNLGGTPEIVDLALDYGSNNAARAHGTTDQTGLASGVYTKANLDVADFDPDSIFDATNHRMTPNVAGTYLVIAVAYLTGVANLTSTQCVIYKNGSAYQYSIAGPTTTAVEAAPSASALVQMNGTTDYVECFGRATTSAGTWTLNLAQAGGTCLNCIRMGP